MVCLFSVQVLAGEKLRNAARSLHHEVTAELWESMQTTKQWRWQQKTKKTSKTISSNCRRLSVCQACSLFQDAARAVERIWGMDGFEDTQGCFSVFRCCYWPSSAPDYGNAPSHEWEASLRAGVHSNLHRDRKTVRRHHVTCCCFNKWFPGFLRRSWWLRTSCVFPKRFRERWTSRAIILTPHSTKTCILKRIPWRTFTSPPKSCRRRRYLCDHFPTYSFCLSSLIHEETYAWYRPQYHPSTADCPPQRKIPVSRRSRDESSETQIRMLV